MILSTPLRRSLLTLLPAFVIAIVFAVVGKLVQPPVMAQLPPFWARPLMAMDAIAFYLMKVLWPSQLAIDYGRSPARVLAHGSFYTAWIVPAVATVLLIWLARRNRAMIIAGALLFVAGVAPVLGFVSFTFQAFSTVADHYLYLSMLGVGLIIATFAQTRAHLIVGAVVILALSIKSFDTTTYWKDNDALFSHTLKLNPRSAMAHTNWAVALAHRQDDPAAIDHLRQATSIDNDYAFAHLNLAGLLLKQNDRAGAVREYTEVLRIYRSQRNYDAALGQRIQEMIDRLSPGTTSEKP